MKLVRSWKAVLVASAILALAGSLAHADTVAKGPYYALPSWDQKLRCDAPSTCPRFQILEDWNSEAVLDRETGLVWEKVPSSAGVAWIGASSHCVGLSKGGRKGWRLPTVQDLATLIDPTQSNPSLPSGHPFTVLSSFYWSDTTNASDATNAWVVYFSSGYVGGAGKSTPIAHVWCVRGGPGIDRQ